VTSWIGLVVNNAGCPAGKQSRAGRPVSRPPDFGAVDSHLLPARCGTFGRYAADRRLRISGRT
jgi:hypothetical protein